MNFAQKLINWYHQTNRDLPWRQSKNPYTVWLSEIILQQTRVEQGLPYYLKFIEAFPKVNDLANADEKFVLKLWQGLGYYSRARNLHFTAKYIVNGLNGEFPKNYKELIKLKGIGDYTASAIASICYNEPNAVVDGNVYRVLSRYYGIKTPINSTHGIKEFKNLAQKLIDTKQSGTYNQAIMDFGALHCKPKNPLCTDCFFSINCIGFNTKEIDFLPVKEKKIKLKHRYFNYLFVITKNKETILNKRVGKGIWQNLYEFPLVESSKKIDVTELIKDENYKKISSKNVIPEIFNKKEIIHKLSHQHIHTTFWILEIEITTLETTKIDNIQKYPVPSLIEKFLNAQNLF